MLFSPTVGGFPYVWQPWLACTKITDMSLENFKNDGSSKTGYHNFSKEVRQWTDQQTYKKSEIILK